MHAAARTLLLTSLSSCLPFAAAGTPGQDDGYVPPRTEHGVPDLQGTWSNASITRLTRPRGVDKLVVTPEEAVALERMNVWNRIGAEQDGPAPVDAAPDSGSQAAAFGTRGYNYFWLDPGTRLMSVRGELRTSFIVDPPDGQIPFRRDAGAGGRRGDRDGLPRIGSFDGPESRPLPERCLLSFSNAGGPVMQNGIYNNNYQIVQTRDHVAILVEMVHDVRIIRLDDAHRPETFRPWLGDSVGRFEGDSLVVETVRPHPQQRALISDQGKVTERFTRVSDDEILYEFTVEDPSRYTQPWRGEATLTHSAEPIYEYACHEGNYALTGILAGAREQEKQGKVVQDVEDAER
jgi:hypothetical protein